MTKVLGLTGGIASGKSTVSNYFKSLNIPVIDADQIAREVMKAGQPVVSEIVETFGPDVLHESGEIDRKRLGTIIFETAKQRKELDRLVQPKIRAAITKEINRFIQQNEPLIVVDIPLLYEEAYEEMVDEVMVINVDSMIQKERLIKREPNLTEAEAYNRIMAQMPLPEKAARADIVIDNNQTVQNTLNQVKRWLEINDEFKEEHKKNTN